MGRPVSRLSDIAFVPSDTHSCSGCSHSCAGPLVKGSSDVYVNGLPVAREGDPGVHSGCCGANTWSCEGCSSTVKVNGKGVSRMADSTKHCGGKGSLTIGSPNVLAGG